MIKSLTVTNHLDESIKIVLGDSDTSGFLITNIEGLGPCKATINSTEMASGDGSIFNSSRLESRNIVISIIYDYRRNDSIEDLRHKSYKYFPIKKKITLSFETERRCCSIAGYVESNEPLIFSPMSGTQISIICPDPYFYSCGKDGTNVTEFGSVSSGFEFTYVEPPDGVYIPFEYGYIMNDAQEEEDIGKPNMEFGTLVITDTHNIVYNGDSEVGLIITITALTNVGDIRISDAEDNKVMSIRSEKIGKLTGKPISKDDIIIISTLHNNKSIKLLREGKYYNVLNCLDKGANWFRLTRGDNVFTYNTSSGDIQMLIENQTLYEGA